MFYYFNIDFHEFLTLLQFLLLICIKWSTVTFLRNLFCNRFNSSLNDSPSKAETLDFDLEIFAAYVADWQERVLIIGLLHIPRTEFIYFFNWNFYFWFFHLFIWNFNFWFFFQVKFYILYSISAKTTSSQEFEKQYKKHSNARSNVQKAKEIYEKSIVQHAEAQGKFNEINKEFADLKKVISTVRYCIYYNFSFLIFLKYREKLPISYYQIIDETTILKIPQKIVCRTITYKFLIFSDFFIICTDMPIRVKCRCGACDVVNLQDSNKIKYSIFCCFLVYLSHGWKYLYK